MIKFYLYSKGQLFTSRSYEAKCLRKANSNVLQRELTKQIPRQ